MTRIMIVDDHPLMRRGLAITLDGEPGLSVVVQAESAEQALDADFSALDLVIADVSLPGMSGLELTKQLVVLYPHLPVLVVSRHDEGLYAERALRAGAKGYVMKHEPSETLVTAVRRVLRGGVYVSPAISDRLLMGIAGGANLAQQSPLDVLSDRELEVFELSGNGVATREIAERLHLSVKTVESYRARIKTKLGLNTAAEFMQHAVQWVTTKG
ncbi:MAG: response regulator transcription factor [Rhodothermales bacterium]|nr:response regulator transcription factor [Rhodothermales bacterium]